MKVAKTFETKLLKIILAGYIIMALVIAGLNFGYAERAAPAVAELINWFWHFYENWVKTIFIILCGFLTLRVVGGFKETAMRKRNIAGFMVFALIVHIIGPSLLNNSELYLFSMPLPWNTTPLQLLDGESPFYLSRFSVLGSWGITASLFFYALISFVVLAGTIIRGRRWQCSTLCLFNGFASEVFAPAFPLVGKPKKPGMAFLRLSSGLRWVFLTVALFFTVNWILHLAGMPTAGDIYLLAEVETFKYLGLELLAAMFFWVVLIGRGYCYYCPLGTVVGLIGKAVGQKIITDNTECISCGKCNRACPMTIDIMVTAKNRADVTELRCVGCGHCVDACPTETLSYSTKFLSGLKHSDHWPQGWWA